MTHQDGNTTRELPLTKGKVAIVDAEDYEWLVRRSTYHAHRSKTTWYARDSDNEYLHRIIMDAPKSTEIDHRDRNGLNCRKSNLRFATRSEQCQNIGRLPPASGYRGVFQRHGREHYARPFYAKIRHRRVDYRLGRFATAEEAARAYDAKARELFGESAFVNFPQQ